MIKIKNKKENNMYINEHLTLLHEFVYEYAMLLMAQQMLNVYNNEGCSYDDPINANTNKKQADGYFNIAFERIKGKSNMEIYKMLDNIRKLNGFDKN